MSEINRNTTELLMNKHGIDISMFDKSFVNKTILQRIDLTGCLDIADYNRFVAENETEAALFNGLLRVSYSEFFEIRLPFLFWKALYCRRWYSARGITIARKSGFGRRHVPVATKRIAWPYYWRTSLGRMIK